MARSHAPLRVIVDPRPPPLLPSAVLGMLIFVLTEIMLFAGLISAFLIVRAQAVGAWPPPGQPRLPLEETALNTAALLVSGFLVWQARRRFAESPAAALRPLSWAMGLGAFFVLFQGYEWAGMLRQGPDPHLQQPRQLLLPDRGPPRAPRGGRPAGAGERLVAPPGRLPGREPTGGRHGILAVRGGTLASALRAGVHGVSARWALFAALAAALVLGAEPAAACAVCSGGDEESRKAFVWTAVLLSVLPPGLVGGFLWWALRQRRERAKPGLPLGEKIEG